MEKFIVKLVGSIIIAAMAIGLSLVLYRMLYEWFDTFLYMLRMFG